MSLPSARRTLHEHTISLAKLFCDLELLAICRLSEEHFFILVSENDLLLRADALCSARRAKQTHYLQ